MNDDFNFDFDSSIARLMDGGYDHLSIPENEVLANLYDLEPMQGQVDVVLGAFFEKFAQYVVERQLDDNGIFTQTDREELGSDEDELMGVVLNQSLEEIMKSQPYMTNGEAFVGGEGIYMVHSDVKKGLDVMSFLEGGSIVGAIETYEAAPLISYEDFIQIQKASRGGSNYNAEVSIVPGVWLVLKDAILLDEAGMAEAQYDSVRVPLNYKSLTFSKVYRQEGAEAVNNDGEQYVDVMAHLAGDLAMELFEDFEDELNFKAFSENIPEVLDDIQRAIDEYTAIIDSTRLIELSATAAWGATDDVDAVQKVVMRYVRTMPQFNNGTWSIVHEFMIDKKDSDGTNVFVLPTHIQYADYLNQE